MRKTDLIIVGVLLFESIQIQLPDERRVVIVPEVFGQQLLGELGGTDDHEGVAGSRPANAVAIFWILVSRPQRFRSRNE